MGGAPLQRTYRWRGREKPDRMPRWGEGGQTRSGYADEAAVKKPPDSPSPHCRLIETVGRRCGLAVASWGPRRLARHEPDRVFAGRDVGGGGTSQRLGGAWPTSRASVTPAGAWRQYAPAPRPRPRGGGPVTRSGT